MITTTPQKHVGRTDPGYPAAGRRVRGSAAHLSGTKTTETMTTGDAVDELLAMQARLCAELTTIERLVRILQETQAATSRELAKFQLGDQLGPTKLARRLGCGRSYATRLLEGELADSVRTRADGSRWVPAAAVDAWLATTKPVAA